MDSVIIDDILPGMTLAEDVYDRNGRFLLAKDLKLTSKHLRILKIWGITAIQIVNSTEGSVQKPPEPEIDSETMDMAVKSLAKRFSHMDVESGVEQELFRLCAARQARTMLGKKQDWSELQPSALQPLQPSDIPCETAKKRNPKKSPFALLEKEIILPALPCIFYQINDAINNPRSSARDIADIIRNDSSLSARLLRIANSVLYGLRSKIDTISRAVVVIGTKEIGSLALGITIMTHFGNIPAHIIDMRSFWKHHMACAIASRVIAGYKNTANLERLFIGGLLHDIGRLIVGKYMPDELLASLQRAQSEDKLLHEVEPETVGLMHSTIGARLLKAWKLPVSLENIVKYHHQPMQATDGLEPAIVNLADIIVNAARIGSSGEQLVAPLDPDLWNYLDLPPSIFATTLKHVDRQLGELTRIFGNGV
ncbi:MAG: HDOD domain-containing protein [Desulforhabdus sp.]|nr:HDOD domain-containing protein [Desulforhabdus sp.]